jgi:uncharacterized protein YjbI with pentapeptide repeats
MQIRSLSGETLFQADGGSLKACVEAAVRRRIDLTGADLRNGDLRGIKLSFAVFERADLSGACLADAFLAYVVFSGARLAGADFTNAYLPYANFIGADLTDARTRGAYLLGVKGWP